MTRKKTQKRIKKKYDSRKVNIVGKFFEELTQVILPKAEVAPVDEGDFHIWGDGGIGVEVKSSDTNHELRLPLYQIDAYARLSSGFPFDSFFYFLFCYDNPYVRVNGSRRVTSLSYFDEVPDVRNYLASNLRSVYVVDAVLIPYPFTIGRMSDRSIPMHPGVQSFNIRSRQPQLLVDGGWLAFRGKIKSLEMRMFSVDADLCLDLLEGYRLNIQVVFLARRERLDLLIKHFDPKLGLSVERV